MGMDEAPLGHRPIVGRQRVQPTGDCRSHSTGTIRTGRTSVSCRLVYLRVGCEALATTTWQTRDSELAASAIANFPRIFAVGQYGKSVAGSPNRKDSLNWVIYPDRTARPTGTDRNAGPSQADWPRKGTAVAKLRQRAMDIGPPRTDRRRHGIDTPPLRSLAGTVFSMEHVGKIAACCHARSPSPLRAFCAFLRPLSFGFH